MIQCTLATLIENDVQKQLSHGSAMETGVGSHAKKKDQTRCRGLGSQRRQSAQATWVVMGERARGENSIRRKFACHPVPRRKLEAQYSASGARTEAPTSSKQKRQQKTWRNSTKDTDEHIQKGQLRATLAGAIHTCARMWARTVVTGLRPACGHENEDLAHLWWNCKNSTLASGRKHPNTRMWKICTQRTEI